MAHTIGNNPPYFRSLFSIYLRKTGIIIIKTLRYNRQQQTMRRQRIRHNIRHNSQTLLPRPLIFLSIQPQTRQNTYKHSINNTQTQLLHFLNSMPILSIQ